MRRTILTGDPPALPEWEDWQGLFLDGLRAYGVFFVYTLPLWIFFVAGYGVMIVPFFVIGFAEAQDRPLPPFWEAAPMLGIFGWMGMFGVAMVAGLLLGLFLPAALGHAVARNDFTAGFRVNEWWPIFRANLGGFAIAYLLILGLWFAMSFAVQILYFTIVLCCLVPFVLVFTSVYGSVITSVLFGQVYREGAERLAGQGGTAAPLGSLS